MKKLILSLAILLPLSSFADGIPVPMEEQTRYNWACQNSKGQPVSLHLMTDELNTLYIQDGATVGLDIGADATAALLKKSYASLSRKTVKDNRFKRQVEFSAQGNLISVRMTDLQYGMKIEALNCVARF